MKNKTKTELQAIVKELITDKVFNCYTRQGFETVIFPEMKQDIKWIIFFDINKMHDLNAKYGYMEVDNRIKNSLVLRKSDVAVCRWYSGDEVVVVGTSDANDINPIITRLQDNFKSNDITFMYSVKTVNTMNVWTDFTNTVKTLSDDVQQQKAKRDC